MLSVRKSVLKATVRHPRPTQHHACVKRNPQVISVTSCLQCGWQTWALACWSRLSDSCLLIYFYLYVFYIANCISYASSMSIAVFVMRLTGVLFNGFAYMFSFSYSLTFLFVVCMCSLSFCAYSHLVFFSK